MLTPQLSQSVPTSSSSVRLPSNGMQGILSQNEEGPKIVVEEEPEEVRRALSQLVEHALWVALVTSITVVV